MSVNKTVCNPIIVQFICIYSATTPNRTLYSVLVQGLPPQPHYTVKEQEQHLRRKLLVASHSRDWGSPQENYVARIDFGPPVVVVLLTD